MDDVTKIANRGKGEGAKNPRKIAYVLYGLSLKCKMGTYVDTYNFTTCISQVCKNFSFKIFLLEELYCVLNKIIYINISWTI